MAEPRDHALRAWGAQLRTARLRQRRLRRRAALAAAAGIAPLATIAVPPHPLLVWNASASAPIGLYAVLPGACAKRGDLVLVRPSRAVRRFAASRGYLPLGVPMLKRIGGLPGDTVCALGPEILVDARRRAVRRPADGEGRPLPWWRGCVRLAPGHLLLLNPAAPDSFDGRYFGPSAAGDLLGRARPLWLR